MCFKNLPIEFDSEGRARLREGVGDPYGLNDGDRRRSYTKVAVLERDPVQEGPRVRDWMIDPVTRVAGALAVHTKLDLEKREAVEGHSMAMLFRGYELILQGRDPRDAIDISSRACGVCGGVHSTVSSLAIEQAFGITPPPMGTIVRNLGEVAEMLYDHPLHLGLLAGPDYSSALVEVTNPELVVEARRTPAPNAATHGYQTIGDIMDAMNPLTGEYYVEALGITRLGREMCQLMYGKYPHPSTLVPGGVMTTLSTSTFNEFYNRLMKYVDYSKKLVGIWDDVIDFFLDQNPDYARVGDRPINLIQTGIWDQPEVYDGTYENASAWGDARWSTPGIIINGELLTTRLHDINMGIEEFVEHSFYEDYATDENMKFPQDSLGNPLSPYHAWNKQTIPKPTGRNFKEKYSWSTAPRWDRMTLETGTYGRMWTTALAQKHPTNDFYEATGDGIRILMPEATLPETEMFWKVPGRLNALERNRGRAYATAWTTAVGLGILLQAFDYWRRGETKTHTKFTIPKDERLGAGFWEAGRGYLTHHLHMDKGKLVNYQINTPSTWNASPRDPFGGLGPYEEAIIGTPILESVGDDDVKGIDVLRSIRSFDPCMPCTTHIDTGKGVITRELNSCSCTLD
ncbi:MAG: cytochrome C [Actinobacteria bacterium]|nr:MAG: cytochrome C [Actinomycetota bacterium]REK32961.1 MAG: cytochrome C [Actinomycetota bacterium]